MMALAVPGTSNQTFGGRSSSGSGLGLRATGEFSGLIDIVEVGVAISDDCALDPPLDMVSVRGNVLAKSFMMAADMVYALV
jgi:hypothetical protein